MQCPLGGLRLDRSAPAAGAGALGAAGALGCADFRSPLPLGATGNQSPLPLLTLRGPGLQFTGPAVRSEVDARARSPLCTVPLIARLREFREFRAHSPPLLPPPPPPPLPAARVCYSQPGDQRLPTSRASPVPRPMFILSKESCTRQDSGLTNKQNPATSGKQHAKFPLSARRLSLPAASRITGLPAGRPEGRPTRHPGPLRVSEKQTGRARRFSPLPSPPTAQRLSTFLRLRPFNTIPHGVVTPPP